MIVPVDTSTETFMGVSTETFMGNCNVFSYPPGMFMTSGDVDSSGKPYYRECISMKKFSRPYTYTLPQGVSGIALMLACDAKIFALEQFQLEIEIRRIVFEFLQPNGSIVTIPCSSPYTEYDEVDTSGTWSAMIHFTGDGIASKVSILGEGNSPLPIDKESIEFFPDACLDEAAR
jgi:hypothetical protein